MTRNPPEATGNPPSDPTATVDAATAVTILRIACSGGKRPVDHLISRLRQPGGDHWFEEVLAGPGLMMPGQARSMLQGTATLVEITGLKDLAKSRLAQAPSDEAPAPLAVYCMCIAAALAHFGVLISSQARSEWDALLIDLSEHVPGAWRSLLISAATSP